MSEKLIVYKRDELTRAEQHFTQKLGDVTRQLSFSGIAIALLIIYGKENHSFQPSLIPLWALLGFAVSLAFDLLHYAYGAVFHTCLNRYFEKKETAGAPGPGVEVLTPRWHVGWNRAKLFLKFAAPLFTTGGYVLLVKFMLGILMM